MNYAIIGLVQSASGSMNYVIIGLDNALSLIQCQAIILTYVVIAVFIHEKAIDKACNKDRPLELTRKFFQLPWLQLN